MKLRGVAAVLSVLVLWLGCGGANEAPATPAVETAAAEPAGDSAPAREAAQAAPTPGVRPCDAYVAEAMRCAREESAATDQPLPDDPDVLEGYLRDRCRGWLLEGLAREELHLAVEYCRSVPCADGSDAWDACVREHSGHVPRPTAYGGPEDWERIEPRPIDPAAAPCDVMIEWMVACARESMGDAELPVEVVEALRDGFHQACDAWDSMPETRNALVEVLRTCADVGCGSGGADLIVCIATKIAEAAGAAAGMPAPTPEPEVAPGYDPNR